MLDTSIQRCVHIWFGMRDRKTTERMHQIANMRVIVYRCMQKIYQQFDEPQKFGHNDLWLTSHDQSLFSQSLGPGKERHKGRDPGTQGLSEFGRSVGSVGDRDPLKPWP